MWQNFYNCRLTNEVEGSWVLCSGPFEYIRLEAGLYEAAGRNWWCPFCRLYDAIPASWHAQPYRNDIGELFEDSDELYCPFSKCRLGTSSWRAKLCWCTVDMIFSAFLICRWRLAASELVASRSTESKTPDGRKICHRSTFWQTACRLRISLRHTKWAFRLEFLRGILINVAPLSNSSTVVAFLHRRPVSTFCPNPIPSRKTAAKSPVGKEKSQMANFVQQFGKFIVSI